MSGPVRPGDPEAQAALARLRAAEEWARDVRKVRRRDLWSAVTCGTFLLFLAGLAVGVVALAVIGWRCLLGGLP